MLRIFNKTPTAIGKRSFQTVIPKDETFAPENVFRVFENSAPNYDQYVKYCWLGLDRLWRKKAIEHINPTHNTKLIDVAGGTGGIGSCFLDFVKEKRLENCHITVCDTSDAMMEIGKKKLAHPDLVTWTKTDFLELPFGDDTFDAYTVAFGLRYSQHIDKALVEAHRVLRPGGKFVCLDFGEVENALAKRFFDFHAKYTLKQIANLFNTTMLVDCFLETLEHYPDKETICEMISTAGFTDVGCFNMQWGLIDLHYGIKK